MEVRGQDKDMGLPMGGFSTNTLPASSAQPNQQEPSNSNKLSSSASIAPTAGRGTNVLSPTTQTLDHHHLHHHHQQQQQQQQQQHHLVPGIRDSNPNPNPNADPDPPPPTTIGGASNSKTTSQPQPQPTNGNSSSTIRYRECLKNHAAAMGGHVVDGCGEFMPGGEEGTPGALKCAACDCHRNFHRKEVDGESQSGANSYLYAYNPNRNHRTTTTHHLGQVPHPLPPPPQHHHHRYSHHGPIPPMLMAFGGGSGAPAESSSEDLNMFHFTQPGTPAAAQPPFSGPKKRYRTKFSQEQKERMQELAERLGWKIQKQDEEEVQQFCAEVGVKRKVLKVWMHNSKQAMKKKQL